MLQTNAKYRRKMSVVRFTLVPLPIFSFENPLYRRQHCPPLGPTGPVGDMVDGKYIAQFVMLNQAFWLVKCREDKRQAGMAQLVQSRLDK